MRIVKQATDPADADLDASALLAQGLGIEMIARRQRVSERTARRHIRAICDQLRVQTPIEQSSGRSDRDLP